MAYAELNGLKMYYETHGKGEMPLFLIPGSLMTTGTFAKMVPELSKNRQVITLDLQGHGRTADIDRPLSTPQLADDIAALAAELGFTQIDVFGFSLGGGIALQLGLRHPELVHKLAIASSGFHKKGWHEAALGTTDFLTPEAMAGSPFEQEYQAVAPKPEDWATLLGKLRALNLDKGNATPEQIKALTMPVLLVVGDADIIRADHMVEFFTLLGGQVFSFQQEGTKSQLAILPGTSHIEVLTRPELMHFLTNFLN